MNVSIALQYLAALFTLPSQVQTKSNILAICVAAALQADAWILGESSERWIEVMSRAMDAWGAVPSQAVAGNFLDLATDPGDVDAFGNPDRSADQTPRPGWLSALGQGWYGTTRGGQTFASTVVTYTNTSGAPQRFGPGAITIERNYTAADGSSPTYRNAPDPSKYTNSDGTLTLGNGGSIALSFVADQIGSYGSATAGSISVLVTQTYGAATLGSSTAATGLDRESANDYRARCRTGVDSLAPGGPLKAYLRAMNTAIDGTILQCYDGSGPTSVNQAYVSPSSATGVVTMYLAGPSGAPLAAEVSSATANISGLLLADPVTGAFHNAVPMGVLPDTVDLGPVANDPAFPGGSSSGVPGVAGATNLTIALTYSVKIRAANVPGGATPGTYTSGSSPPAPIAAIFSSIAAVEGAGILGMGIGGLDQVAGAGVVYTADLVGILRGSFANLYDPAITAPSGSTTAVALGYVPVLGTVTGTLVVT